MNETITKTVETYDGMSVPQYSETEVTIEQGGDWRAPDEWVVSWFSARHCKTMHEYYEDQPDDEDIALCVKESEEADEARVIA